MNGTREHRDRPLTANGSAGEIRRHGLVLMHESTMRSPVNPVCALNDRSLKWQVAIRHYAGINSNEMKSYVQAPFERQTCR